MMELRDYQNDLIDRLFKAYTDGFKAPCIVLPCGGGKSVIVAAVAKHFTDKHKRVLFLVHRKELCEQITSTFVRAGVDLYYCKIAMVQTVSRRLMQELVPDLIITDENHHALADTYRKIYNHFPDAKRLGVTATPLRTNGAGLADVNDILIEGVNVKWLIENNFLSPYDYYAPDIKTPKFRVRHGDFDQSQVANFFRKNVRKIYGDVLSHYKRLANNKQAICYLPTVDVSKLTAAQFVSSGIPAAHIDGETPKAERDRIITDFRNGDIKILCNVDIISEGFDVPDCECVILLRPTKSLVLFIQQSMRCMRYKPGKRAIIIDHVNNIDRHGFPDAEREWSLDGIKKEKGEMPLKTCPVCFAAVAASTRKCPHCEYEFTDTARRESTEPEHENIELVNITAQDKVKFYISPKECLNVEELKIYARQHGYKPGWVWYQQKERGWLNERKGNNNTKRYPCRPV